MLSAAFTIDFSPLTAQLDRMSAVAIAGTSDPSVRASMTEAMQVYLGAMRRRFSSASHGDGTWADLAASTKLARAYRAGQRFKRQKGVTRLDRLRVIAAAPFPILYVTGDLYTSLVPGEPGNVFEVDGDSVRAGTSIFYAQFHQTGGKRLPRRAILVEPDQETTEQMQTQIISGFRQAFLGKAA